MEMDLLISKKFRKAQKKGGRIGTMDIQSALDKNGDGKIRAKVQEMLRRLREGCTLYDCGKMVKAADTDVDGMVNMDGFMAMMTQSMRHG